MVIQNVLTTMALFAITGAVIPNWLPMKDKLHRRSLDCGVAVTCVVPVVMKLRLDNGFNLAEFVNEDDLNTLCQELHAMEECIKNVVNSCKPTIPNPMLDVLAETAEGLVHYVCSHEGRDAILTERECWVDSTLLTAAGQCYNDLRRDANVTGPNHCQLINRFFDCTVDAARNICSEKATRFVDRFMYYGYGPAARILYQCDLQTRMTRDLMKVLKGF